ncbi:MAG: hypothetical protein WAV23_00915 [Minisyncoccia bacterium]
MIHFLQSILYVTIFLPNMMILVGIKRISEYFQKMGLFGKVVGFLLYVISLPFDFIVKQFK